MEPIWRTKKEYTVVICGFLKGMEDELNQQDTGIVGLDAAKEYLKNVKEVSSGTLDDSLVKEQKKRPLCVRMLGSKKIRITWF